MQPCDHINKTALRNLGNSSSIPLRPDELDLQPETRYTFKVEVESKIGDPDNDLTRFGMFRGRLFKQDEITHAIPICYERQLFILV